MFPKKKLRVLVVLDWTGSVSIELTTEGELRAGAPIVDRDGNLVTGETVV